MRDTYSHNEVLEILGITKNDFQSLKSSKWGVLELNLSQGLEGTGNRKKLDFGDLHQTLIASDLKKVLPRYQLKFLCLLVSSTTKQFQIELKDSEKFWLPEYSHNLQEPWKISISYVGRQKEKEEVYLLGKSTYKGEKIFSMLNDSAGYDKQFGQGKSSKLFQLANKIGSENISSMTVEINLTLYHLELKSLLKTKG